MAINFKELPQSIKAPSVQALQAEIQLRFWELLKSTKLKRWRKGDSFATAPRWLLVGLAPSFEIPDLELADALAAKMQDESSGIAIEVFDVQDATDQEDLQNYVPGIGKVFHTPIVGFWVNGRLIEKAEGFAGRELVKRIISQSARD